MVSVFGTLCELKVNPKVIPTLFSSSHPYSLKNKMEMERGFDGGGNS